MKTSLLAICLVYLLSTSCVTYSKLRYFNEVDSKTDTYSVERTPKTIQPFDKLYIKVFGIDERAQKAFSNNEGYSGFSDASLSSYIVNDSGKIAFPFIGTIQLSGLTVEQAGRKIQAKLSEYLSNTDVIVRFISNHISVLGEVEHQGDFTYNEDKLTIYQALAMAGGLTRYGNRKEIVIMRKTEHNVVYSKVNLNDKKLVQGSYFYLLPGDVVIVEPLKAVAFSYQNSTYTNILATFSTLASLVSSLYIIRVIR